MYKPAQNVLATYIRLRIGARQVGRSVVSFGPAADYALLSVLFLMNTFLKLPQQKGLLFMQPDWASAIIPFPARQGRLSAVSFYSVGIQANAVVARRADSQP